MTTLTGKLINNTYKQLVKIGVSTNTGFTTALTTIEDGDGSASSLQLATNAAKVDGNLFVAGKFGVSSDASVAGNLAISNKVCASAFHGDATNMTGVSGGPVGQQAVTANSGTTTIDLSSGNEEAVKSFSGYFRVVYSANTPIEIRLLDLKLPVPL